MKRHKPANDVQVVLVHGTFASSEEDKGQDWWQIGSDFYRELTAKLRPYIPLSKNDKVFHWSGENSERARSRAAAKLLQFVEPLEREGKDYHLVGHSHGGSVIWAALRLATVRREELKHLRSWSTVGTPFMHHRSRSPWSPTNMLYMLLGAALLFPVARTLLFVAKLAFGEIKHGVVIAGNDRVSPLLAVLRAPFIKGLELFGVPIVEVDQGIRVGNFMPGSGVSLASYLFGSVEGWLILCSIGVFAYLTILLSSYCVGPVCEVFRIAREKKLEQRTFQQYGQRWLGLWSPDDEAINGLRKTLELSVSFVGTLVPRERIFVSDLISLPSRPLLSVVAPFYNRLLRPALDSTICNLVVKAAQGNNRPAAEVVAVSPHPILPPNRNTAAPVPPELRERLLTQANLHAQKLGPKIREFLGEPSFAVGLEKLGQTLESEALVHTSYFNHAETVDLLAMNILSCQTPDIRPTSDRRDLVAWFAQFRRDQLSITDPEAIVLPNTGTSKKEFRPAA